MFTLNPYSNAFALCLAEFFIVASRGTPLNLWRRNGLGLNRLCLDSWRPSAVARFSVAIQMLHTINLHILQHRIDSAVLCQALVVHALTSSRRLITSKADTGMHQRPFLW